MNSFLFVYVVLAAVVFEAFRVLVKSRSSSSRVLRTRLEPKVRV